jgi:hypothetical protein
MLALVDPRRTPAIQSADSLCPKKLVTDEGRTQMANVGDPVRRVVRTEPEVPVVQPVVRPEPTRQPEREPEPEKVP